LTDAVWLIPIVLSAMRERIIPRPRVKAA
jgi:hypothetical protein